METTGSGMKHSGWKVFVTCKGEDRDNLGDLGVEVAEYMSRFSGTLLPLCPLPVHPLEMSGQLCAPDLNNLHVRRNRAFMPDFGCCS